VHVIHAEPGWWPVRRVVPVIIATRVTPCAQIRDDAGSTCLRAIGHTEDADRTTVARQHDGDMPPTTAAGRRLRVPSRRCEQPASDDREARTCPRRRPGNANVSGTVA
jgi:hypothetical protein